MNPCVFCQILAGKLPASIVYQDEHVIAFLDIRPVNPGHVLVVPRIHEESLENLSAEKAMHMMRIAQRVMAGLRNTELRCEGINLFLADGSVAGQEIPHAHLHVIPRFTNDGFGLRFASGYGEMPQRARLDDLAAAIQKALC
jgi:histidine triad (HIT) family protein